MGFRDKLARRQEKAKTLVCVGLDPLPEKMPQGILAAARGAAIMAVELWMRYIVGATAQFACMFKPQSAHWEAIPGGVEALKNLIAYIHEMFPDIPVLLDCKRGDIARTQKQYGVAHLVNLGADGMNFCPYMGRDTMAALVSPETKGKALVGLCYTSNSDARQVQDALMNDSRPLWQHVAEWTKKWASELNVLEDAGLVMAAAYEKPPKGSKVIYSDHLTQCRKIVGETMWFLIPGIGTQGGFIEETVRTAYRGPGSIALNSSSEIIFAGSGPTFMEDSARKAMELRDAINNAL